MSGFGAGLSWGSIVLTGRLLSYYNIKMSNTQLYLTD